MPQYLEYYGNTGLIIAEKGTLATDRYGLDSATAVWKCPMDNIAAGPQLGSVHPIWNYLVMERRRLDIAPGFLIITGEYVGIAGGSTPSVFECSFAEVEEPIQAHPDFVTSLAGKPSAPLNGAIFVDFETQKKSTSDSRGVFLEFAPVVAGNLNPLAGVTSFLSPQATMRETWMSTSAVSAGALGTISAPPFSVGLPAGGNWLFTGVSFQQRGRVYANSREWRSSGRRGWNSDIY